MDFIKKFTYFFSFMMIALLTVVWGVSPVNAAQSCNILEKSALTQIMFATPDEAVKALRAATEAKDKTALSQIFGAQVKELLTGDKVQDENNFKRFVDSMSQSCVYVKEGEDKIVLEVGPNNWPLPIPLVKANGQWYFDTAAGKEEIINRYIGKDEFTAIGVCRAYVKAQEQYAGANPKVSGGTKYAQKFKSSPGKKDGLYWPTAENELASPFGPLVAQAHSEGYGGNKGSGQKPFHGYYFKILTRQGKSASGGKIDYISHGDLTNGFALVAYPENWDRSGIMTFIVNQDGKVFQKNLGEKTLQIAGAMKEYDPDNGWTLVPDEGILSAVSEQ